MAEEERDPWDPNVAADYDPNATPEEQPEIEGGIDPNQVQVPESEAPQPGGGTEAPGS